MNLFFAYQNSVKFLEKKFEIDNSKTATKPTIIQPLNFDNFLCSKVSSGLGQLLVSPTQEKNGN